MQKENQASKYAPANRLTGVSEYYFSKKLKEVAQMNAEGKNVISLGIGSPDMPPSEQTVSTLCQEAQNADGHGYQPYVGIPELRKAFAGWYQQWYNVELNPNTEIQPLIGSKEGILHVTLAFVNPGEQVLVPNPGYPTYTSLSNILGAEVVTYNLKEENGWMPDFEELEAMDLTRVKLMWTNYPNMPTGANATPELYEKLVDFARRKGIIIVNDNPYSFILNDKPLSILSVPAIYPDDRRIIYPTLGLTGEAGEVADKVKKVIRDAHEEFTPEKKLEIVKEIGDVMWYCATLARDLGYELDDVAQMNVDKLRSRMQRNHLTGSGDNR
jgi:aspartate/methionine/tyrosine aminotransferase/NTP pyrophosphatase (non-canonical NTP hydrolase)